MATSQLFNKSHYLLHKVETEGHELGDGSLIDRCGNLMGCTDDSLSAAPTLKQLKVLRQEINAVWLQSLVSFNWCE